MALTDQKRRYADARLAGMPKKQAAIAAYGRPAQETIKIPTELAVLIVKKACRLAEKLENEAIDQMTRDVRRALQRGTAPAEIARQMEL